MATRRAVSRTVVRASSRVTTSRAKDGYILSKNEAAEGSGGGDEDEDDKSSLLVAQEVAVYYAVRPCLYFEQPVLFFALKDLELAWNSIQLAASNKSGRSGELAAIPFEKFGKLAPALDYLHDAQPAKTRGNVFGDADTTAAKTRRQQSSKLHQPSSPSTDEAAAETREKRTPIQVPTGPRGSRANEENDADDESAVSDNHGSRKTSTSADTKKRNAASSTAIVPRKRRQAQVICTKGSSSSTKWENYFNLLKQYKEEFGDCNVPSGTNQRSTKFKGTKYEHLVQWATQQRTQVRLYEEGPTSSALTKEEYKLLRNLGFRKTMHQANATQAYNKSFEANLKELQEYKAIHGTLLISWHRTNYSGGDIMTQSSFWIPNMLNLANIDVPKGSKLNAWLWRQRRQYDAMQQGKQVNLTAEKLGQLAALGFSMTTSAVRPKAMKDRVQEYVEFYHTYQRHPSKHKAASNQESRLASNARIWRQKRNLFQKGILNRPRLGNCELPRDLIQALDAVNFRWAINEKIGTGATRRTILGWDARFELLKQYKAKHGHCDPPKRHPTLGMFAVHQRTEYKRMVNGVHSKTMTLERIRKLSEIGFRFRTAPVGHSRVRPVVDGSSSGYDTSSGSSSSSDESDVVSLSSSPRNGDVDNEDDSTEDEDADKHSKKRKNIISD